MLNILHEKRVWLSFEKVVHRICCCCCSVTKSCSTLCNPMDCSTPGLPVPHHLPEFAEVHVRWSVMSSNHLILCCPLFLLPSIFPSIRVFSGEWAICIGWPNYRSFSFTVSPSNEYSGFISLRIDWFALAVKGTHKSLLKYHNSKASILLCSAFLLVHLLHLYLTTGKTIVIAYGEQCLIYDLRRRFRFGTRDQAWSFESFCVAEFY